MSKEFFQAIEDMHPNWKPEIRLEDLITVFTHWSVNTGFPEATAQSSINKLREEIDELDWVLKPGWTKQDLLDEYVDCLMCTFDSSARAGFSTKEIVHAFKLKLEKNMQRKWKKNEDNTYSHI